MPNHDGFRSLRVKEETIDKIDAIKEAKKARSRAATVTELVEKEHRKVSKEDSH